MSAPVKEGLLSSAGFSRPPSRVAPGGQAVALSQVSTAGQAGGPGTLQGRDPIPQDPCGLLEGPPECQILPSQQHAGLGAHEEAVIVPSLAHSSGGWPPSCRGGRDGDTQGLGGMLPVLSPDSPARLWGSQGGASGSCCSSFRITREPRWMQRPAS